MEKERKPVEWLHNGLLKVRRDHQIIEWPDAVLPILRKGRDAGRLGRSGEADEGRRVIWINARIVVLTLDYTEILREPSITVGTAPLLDAF